MLVMQNISILTTILNQPFFGSSVCDSDFQYTLVPFGKSLYGQLVFVNAKWTGTYMIKLMPSHANSQFIHIYDSCWYTDTYLWYIENYVT